MKIVQKELTKTSKGWIVIFLIDLEGQDISQFLNKYSRYLVDYEIVLKDKNLYLKRYFEKLEPWEDETPEEVVKSIKLELTVFLNS